jgi:hypothetical protein
MFVTATIAPYCHFVTVLMTPYTLKGITTSRSERQASDLLRLRWHHTTTIAMRDTDVVHPLCFTGHVFDLVRPVSDAIYTESSR